MPTDDIPPIEMLPPTTCDAGVFFALHEPKGFPPIDARRLLSRKKTPKSARHLVNALFCVALALIANEAGRHVGRYVGRLPYGVDIPDIPWGVLIAGFCAQLVDGSLGMGYGITSATVLTSVAGLSPTQASSAVHLAQLGTTAVSGYSHRRCGNLHAATLRPLSTAGVVGALMGSTLLSSLNAATAKCLSGSTLFLVGLYVVLRFATMSDSANGERAQRAPRLTFLLPIGLVGGCVDAMGGGGWGPVATSGLLAEGRLPPCKVIGTVSLSEFFVTVAAVAGFLLTLGPSHAASGALRLDLALTLLLGGLLAAPIAPLMVRKIEARALGIVVGTFICLTNARALTRAAAWLG